MATTVEENKTAEKVVNEATKDAKQSVETVKAEGKKTSKNEDSNILAMLSYLWILSVVFYIIKKDEDDFVVFHARQGMVLLGASIVLFFLGFIPLLGWLVGFFGWIAIIVLSIIGMIKAYQGERYNIPGVGDLAKKINF